MKISIWQQFSSNHSANFEIVGIFKTDDLGHQAAKMLRETFRAIDAERTAYEPYCYDCPPTSAEVLLAKQYDIGWGNLSLDWLVLDDGDVRNVSELDQFVFVTNLRGDNTWMGDEPIDRLIRAIGGDVMVTGEFYGPGIRVDIRCTAPDEKTAISLNEQLNSYWQLHPPDEENDPIKIDDFPPWINFWKGGEHILSNIWVGSVEDLAKKHLAKATLSLDQSFAASGAIYDTATGGEIRRSGQEVTITRLARYEPGRFLPSLVDFLRSKGCTDLYYDVGPEPFSGD